MTKKSESLQEYLARGGKITVCPTVPPKEADKRHVKSTVSTGVANILSYEEADQLFGTKTVRQKQKKANTEKTTKKLEDLKKGIDKLPQSLRDKLGL